MRLEVDTEHRRILIGQESFPCEIGRAGAIGAADKHEGDDRTPLGCWPLRGAILRRDREMAPPAALPWRWMRDMDGWCDDPNSPIYNRAVWHPSRWSAERLWRDDHVYDAVIVLGHNDDPPVPGRGSAIFLHLAGPGATAGCVGIDTFAMSRLLGRAGMGMSLAIR